MALYLRGKTMTPEVQTIVRSMANTLVDMKTRLDQPDEVILTLGWIFDIRVPSTYRFIHEHLNDIISMASEINADRRIRPYVD